DGYPCERHRSRKQLALVGWPLAVAPCERLVASRPYGCRDASDNAPTSWPQPVVPSLVMGGRPCRGPGHGWPPLQKCSKNAYIDSTRFNLIK
ncbi:hypothetical protein BHE74_00027954, partial [Ensete ventricosum]